MVILIQQELIKPREQHLYHREYKILGEHEFEKSNGASINFLNRAFKNKLGYIQKNKQEA